MTVVEKYKVGDVLDTGNVSSWSIDSQISASWVSGPDSSVGDVLTRGVVFRLLNSKRGTYIGDVSRFPFENEFLTGGKVQITGIENAGRFLCYRRQTAIGRSDMSEETKPKYSQDELEMMFGDRDYLEYARENQGQPDVIKNETEDPNPQNHDENPKGRMVESAMDSSTKLPMDLGDGWTLSRTPEGGYKIDDGGWLSDYPVRYRHSGQVVYDRPERIPQKIQDAVGQALNAIESGSRVGNLWTHDLKK